MWRGVSVASSSPGLTAFDVGTVGQEVGLEEVQNHKRGGNSVEAGCGASDKAHIAALTRANRSMSEHCFVLINKRSD
jgi:hypothetical protein